MKVELTEASIPSATENNPTIPAIATVRPHKARIVRTGRLNKFFRAKRYMRGILGGRAVGGKGVGNWSGFLAIRTVRSIESDL